MSGEVSRAKAIATHIAEANKHLGRAYELLVEANLGGRQFDFTNAPDLGVDHLLTLTEKIKRLYFQLSD